MSKEDTLRTVLITGASSGIGRATALGLDRAGYRVLAGVRRPEDATSLMAKAGPHLETIILDVTKSDDIEAARLRVSDTTGTYGLFALINNAGINYNAAYEYTDDHKARTLMDVNLFGAHALSVAMIPLLRLGAQKSGMTSKLINICSIGGVIALPWGAFYHASKFALLGLSESVRHEVFSQGIRVCVIMPGITRTAFMAKSAAGSIDAIKAMPPEGVERYGEALTRMAKPAAFVERMGSSPEVVAKRIADLLSRENPPFRTIVGADAKVMNILHAILPTALFHKMLRSMFAC